MSEYTKNLNLFKYEVGKDDDLPFSITRALNNNWDKLDEYMNGCVFKESLVEVHTIIESFVDATSGYVVWTSGFCIQWGRFYNNAYVQNVISLLKTMRDTYYLCLINHGVTGMYTASCNGEHSDEPYEFTTDSFKAATYNVPGLDTISWLVIGYVKEGTY